LYPKFDCQYLPTAQSTHTAPFSPEKPALQAQDIMLELAGGDDEFRHSVHSDMSSDEYEPAAQTEHVYADEWTTSEYFPAAQAVHATGPGCSLYLPATQPTQVLFSPVHPASQMQSVSETLSAGDVDPGGHARHSCPSSDK